MSILLNEGQEILLDKLKTWYNEWMNHSRIGDHPQWFSYSGAAGTGKTTVVREFIDLMGFDDTEYVCCAYVGKAVLNLQKHGLPAKTVHSLIYDPLIIKIPKLDEEGDPITDKNDNPIYKMEMRFSLKEALDPELKLIIVDEATMINDDMKNKILSFDIPVIFIGDMNQLPPIFGYSSVMVTPNYALTQIMRQHENDPIVILSQDVLHGVPFQLGQYGKSAVVDHYDISKDLLTRYDEILCGKNATRDKINDTVLYEILHRKDNVPFIGAKMVNRQNNWDHVVNGVALTNGLIGYITNIRRRSSSRGYYQADFKPDFLEDEFEDLRLDVRYLNSNAEQRKNFGLSKYEKFEYAYAITVHSSQGSEWPNVMYIDEWFHDAGMMKKLRYTAITRAEESITIVIPQRQQNQYWSGVRRY